MDLIIENLTSDRLIRLDLKRFRIEVPWCRQFGWLEDPRNKGPRPWLYSFSGLPTLSFERDEVLNHRLRRQSVLLPGDELEGMLMGVGEGAVPDEFHDRQRFSTRLSAYYERGKVCNLTVDFMVQRQLKKKATSSQTKAMGSRRNILTAA